MENIPIEEIVVDLEETDNGQQRIKRLKGGAHPLDILGQVFSEENEKYKAANNGAPLLEWGIHREPGKPGERPHDVAIIYSIATNERVALRKFILVDRATNRPIQVPQKMPNGHKNMARVDTLEHVGKVLDFEAMKAESIRRGVELRASATWTALERMKENAEG